MARAGEVTFTECNQRHRSRHALLPGGAWTRHALGGGPARLASTRRADEGAEGGQPRSGRSGSRQSPSARWPRPRLLLASFLLVPNDEHMSTQGHCKAWVGPSPGTAVAGRLPGQARVSAPSWSSEGETPRHLWERSGGASAQGQAGRVRRFQTAVHTSVTPSPGTAAEGSEEGRTGTAVTL